jgi:hypothetical protein
MLAGNRLTALPPELARQQLSCCIIANQLTQLPDWLLRLAALMLACAGKPMNDTRGVRAAEP